MNAMKAKQQYLRLCNDKGSEAVVANGTGHSQHAHHPHSIPEQDLSSCCLHTSLQTVTQSSQLEANARHTSHVIELVAVNHLD